MSQAALCSVRLDLIAPEIVLATFGMLALAMERLVDRDRQYWVGYLSFFGVVGAMLALAVLKWKVVPQAGPEDVESAFSGLFVYDTFSFFFKYLFLIATGLVILVSMRYLDEERAHHGEYYSVLLFATLGMMFMASGSDLITMFVGLELMALSAYVLVGFARTSRRSNEAAMKYFVLGAMSSAFFVYGVSLFYGVAGSTSLDVIAAKVTGEGASSMALLGLILLSVGLAFKVAAVPFHAWAPDVYEGAPTPVTAYLSVASKAAAFAILLRILLQGLYDLRDSWTVLLSILAIASMVFGNLVAVVQDNVKRMLAYSSIAHAGYALIGVLAAGASVPDSVAAGDHQAWVLDLQRWAQGGVLIYLFAYTFMNIGAFGLVAYLRRRDIVGEDIRDFAGLAQRSPWAAGAMTVFLLSLGGIPPTAGFVGKLILFSSAIKAQLWLVAIVAVLMTAVSLYFYLRIVVQMFIKEPREEAGYAWSWELVSGVAVALFATLLVGLWPQPFVEMARRSILKLEPASELVSRLLF